MAIDSCLGGLVGNAGGRGVSQTRLPGDISLARKLWKHLPRDLMPARCPTVEPPRRTYPLRRCGAEERGRPLRLPLAFRTYHRPVWAARRSAPCAGGARVPGPAYAPRDTPDRHQTGAVDETLTSSKRWEG